MPVADCAIVGRGVSPEYDVTESISDCALCPKCRARLNAAFDCAACGVRYPLLGSVRVLLSEPSSCVERWRMQLALVLSHASEAIRALAADAAGSDVGESTRTRLRALAGGIAEHASDIAAVLEPVLGGPLPPRDELRLPRGTMDYVNCLFRDWAWAGGQDPENHESLAAIRRVTEGRGLGRTLVLGAGGCRLAYDLHLGCGGTETTAVDIDPFLLLMAEAVIRGGTVDLTEVSVNAPEVDPVSYRWRLSAPSGPLGTDVFRLFLANGVEPPFADQTFDTVVTPWFIDQVPTDLAALLRRLHALLVPGGRWINQGPLIYPPDALPIARWYTRQEIFELAKAIGFRITTWEAASVPHFVTPFTGRGLIENVLTFEAVRE